MKHVSSLPLFFLVLFPMASQAFYNDAEIDFLEEQIPEQAVMALKMAYLEALASGSCVLIVKDGALLEVAPDGSERKIKELSRWIPATDKCTESDSNIGNRQGSSCNFTPGMSATPVSQGASEGVKLQEKPTPSEPIFETRAVYMQISIKTEEGLP